MSSQIALLRGINVGGKHSLPMSELTAVVESRGGTNVRTYIQSGNVVFESSTPWGTAEVADLGRAIFAAKGFAPHILLLGAEEFRAAIAANPYASAEGKSLHFYFLAAIPKAPDLERLGRLKAASERFSLIGRVFYLLAPDGVGRSRLAPAVESAVGVPATARNWNTVRELASMIDPAPRNR